MYSTLFMSTKAEEAGMKEPDNPEIRPVRLSPTATPRSPKKIESTKISFPRFSSSALIVAAFAEIALLMVKKY